MQENWDKSSCINLRKRGQARLITENSMTSMKWEHKQAQKAWGPLASRRPLAPLNHSQYLLLCSPIELAKIVRTNRQGTELGQLKPPSLRCSQLQLSVSASLQPCPWPLPYNSDLRHLLHTTVQTDTDTQTLDFISDTHKQQKIKREGSFSLPSPVSLKHHCFLCEAFKEKTEIKWEGCKKCLVQNTICAMPLLFHELQK